MAGTLQLVAGAFPVVFSSENRTTSCRSHQVLPSLPSWRYGVEKCRPFCLHSDFVTKVYHSGVLKDGITRNAGPDRPLRFSARAATSDKGLGSDDSPIELRNAVIVASPPEGQKLRLRVDIPGQDTQKAFDILLAGLARNSPPVPGFRKSKGGKTSTVPKKVLLQLLGETRVRRFVLEEIIRSSLQSYVKKENLKVNEKLTTSQSADELYDVFEPGQAFGFDAELELESESDGAETDELVDAAAGTSTAADAIIDVTPSEMSVSELEEATV